MKHREVAELVVGGATLGLSLYIAFGPLRHRLPRFFSRIAKYSAALKLLSLSGLCWYGLYRNVSHDGPMALRWGTSCLGVAFIAAAVYVLRRPVVHHRPGAGPPATPPPPPDQRAGPGPGVTVVRRSGRDQESPV